MPYQGKATYEPADYYIKRKDTYGAGKIKLMRYKPEKHLMDSEWNADADPEQQIVYRAILQIDRLEKRRSNAARRSGRMTFRRKMPIRFIVFTVLSDSPYAASMLPTA